MNYLEILKLSLKNLWSHKLRTFLTMLGIIMGIGSVVLLSSLGTGIRNNILSDVENSLGNALYVQINPKYTKNVEILKDYFNKNDEKAIESINEVDSIVVAGSLGGSNPKIGVNFMRLEAQDLKNPTTKLNILKGRNFNIYDYENKSNSVILSDTTANKIFKNEDPIGKTIQLEDFSGGVQKYKVVGVAKSTNSLLNTFTDNGYITSAYYLDNAYDKDISRLNIYPNITFKAKDIKDIPIIKEKVQKYLLTKNSKPDFYEIKSAKDEIGQVTSIIGKITGFVNMVAAISLIVGGIGVMNIMLVSVKERISEIGLRKAIGAKNSDIMKQFMIETVFLTFIGGLIGVLVGFGIANIIGIFAKIQPVLTIKMLLISCAISSLIGIVFGIYPARQAAKLSPIEALRSE